MEFNPDQFDAAPPANVPDRESPFTPMAAEVDQPPKLGIAHLLLWTACAAVMLTAERKVGEMQKLLWHQEERDIFVQFLYSAYALAAAPGIAAWVTLAARWRRGQHWRIQPGLWLMALYGLGTLAYFVGIWIDVVVQNLPYMGLFYGLGMGVSATAWLLTAILARLPAVYRVLVAGFAMRQASLCYFSFLDFGGIRFLLDLFFQLYSFLVFALPCLLIVCLVMDRLKRIRRDWLHWTGIAVISLDLALTIVEHFYYG